MGGHASHNEPGRDSRPDRRGRRVLLGLVGALAFLGLLGAGLLFLPHTEVGRMVGAHLTILASPDAWIP